MKLLKTGLIAILIGGTAVTAAVWRHATRANAAAEPMGLTTRAMAAMRPVYDPTIIDASVRCFENRAHADPGDAIDYAILAGDYLQRCRQTGDIADAKRAEAAARHSLAIRSHNNYAGFDELALSLFTQHDFPAALAVARRSAALRPDDPQAAATTAEIEIESGDYTAGERHLDDMTVPGHPNPFTLALSARLMEFRGDLSGAVRNLSEAAALADNDYDLPRENIAWFHMRIGNILAESGDAIGAEQAYDDALSWDPDDYRTMLAMARELAGEHKWAVAIDYGERSAAIVPTPDVTGLLVDCYQAAGQTEKAANARLLMEAMDKLARSQGIIYDRQRAMYCADHDEHVDEAVALARHELTVRHDIYAYDTLAWALCRAGRLSEARAAIDKALATGSRDALLFYHQGIIEYAQADENGARRDLSEAIELNPYFHPIGRDVAAQTLVMLNGPKTGISTARRTL